MFHLHFLPDRFADQILQFVEVVGLETSFSPRLISRHDFIHSRRIFESAFLILLKLLGIAALLGPGGKEMNE